MAREDYSARKTERHGRIAGNKTLRAGKFAIRFSYRAAGARLAVMVPLRGHTVSMHQGGQREHPVTEAQHNAMKVKA